MNAIVLTDEMASELESVNAGSGPRRRVEARRLADGRLIVNADLLEDETAAAWHRVLAQGTAATVTEGELGSGEG